MTGVASPNDFTNTVGFVLWSTVVGVTGVVLLIVRSSWFEARQARDQRASAAGHDAHPRDAAEARTASHAPLSH